MQIRCVLIDDEPLALEVLKQYMKSFPELQLVKSFDDPIAGKDYMMNYPVDLLFVDINMPDMKGTDLVRSITSKPMIIFTTAYKNYAAEGFELDAVDYLVKPIELERFAKAVHKATDFFQYKLSKQSEMGSLFVRAEYQLVKINFNEIEYIESVEDYLKIYLTNSKPVMTLMTMKAVLDKLPASQFFRIHRSYIVSRSRIKTFVNRKITLQSGVELPVSNSYIDMMKSWVR